MFFRRGNLHPGHYELHFAKDRISALTQIRDFKVVLAGKAARPGAALLSSWVFDDTLLTIRNDTADRSITHRALPHAIVIPFSIDPSVGQRIAGWESATDLTYGEYLNTGRWEGDVGLRYIGPINR